MTILVTGGTGFIGSNIVKYLCEHYKSQIIVYDRNLKKNNMIENDKVSYVKGVIEEREQVMKLKKYNFDYIFHQAATVDTTVTDREIMFLANVESFHNIMELVNSNTTVVYASSAAIYGNTLSPNIVGFGEQPENIYGESKLKMDQVADDYRKKLPNNSIIGLRYFNV